MRDRESHIYETMYYTCLRIPSRLDWLHRETLCIAGSCARPDAGVVIVTPGSGPEYEEHGALASPLARQAMAYAYDYHIFVTDILKGFGKQANGPLPSTVTGRDNALQPYVTNLTKAKSLLAQAGVKPGTVLTLIYQAGDERSKSMSEVLQGQLALLGLVLKIQALDATAFANLLYNPTPAAKLPNFIANYRQPDYNDPIDYLLPLYHSRGSTPAGGANAEDYHSTVVDNLFVQAARTAAAAPRQVLLNCLQSELTFTDPAAIYVADVTENPVYRTTVHGFVINPELDDTYDYYAIWKS